MQPIKVPDSVPPLDAVFATNRRFRQSVQRGGRGWMNVTVLGQAISHGAYGISPAWARAPERWCKRMSNGKEGAGPLQYEAISWLGLSLQALSGGRLQYLEIGVAVCKVTTAAKPVP